MKDLNIRKLVFYSGPNYYLNTRAMVFNLFVAPDGPRVSTYEAAVLEEFPQLPTASVSRVVDLYVMVLQQVLRLEIDLPIRRFDILRDEDEFVVAIEVLDDHVGEEAAYLVRDWFRAVGAGEKFPFRTQFSRVIRLFDRSLLGGPTIYALHEAALRRDIPVFYFWPENAFQWGYGAKGLRGRSTVLHTDSIRDTEFTTYKDRVKEFLNYCGFPVPQGKTVFEEEEIIEAAEAIGYPVVVKPVAGHKGKGVRTNLFKPKDVVDAFRVLVNSADEDESARNGVIVEQQIMGSDYRLLAVEGRFVAAIHREPASVVGDGRATIEELVTRENARPERADTIRSPLAKIKIDPEMHKWLDAQGLSIRSVPEAGKKVFLRRIANLSAGGSSINVTGALHPANRKLVEDIAAFFKVTCLGIDVIAQDVTRPWSEGNFAIIEINAGPGIFMHMAPAVGEPIDVAGLVLEAHFPGTANGRVPLVASNAMTPALAAALRARLLAARPGTVVGALTPEGIAIDGVPFGNRPDHVANVGILLRHPRVEALLVHHSKDDIFDAGTVHEGADIAVLVDPHYAEEVLARDVIAGGVVVRVEGDALVVRRGAEELLRAPADRAKLADQIADALAPHLTALLAKYL